MKNLNQTKRKTSIVLSILILSSALDPSFLQANFFDDVKKMGCLIFTKSTGAIVSIYRRSVKAVKKNEVVIKRKIGNDKAKYFADKAENFLKKYLPVISVLAAFSAVLYFSKRSVKVNTNKPDPRALSKPLISSLTWASKKLFGGALVTAGVCGVILLSWKMFLKKLFDNSVDGTFDRAGGFLDKQITRVIQDGKKFVKKVRDGTFDRADEFLDGQRTRTIRDGKKFVEEIRDTTLNQADEFVDKHRRKITRDGKRVIEEVMQDAPGALTKGAFFAPISAVAGGLRAVTGRVSKMFGGGSKSSGSGGVRPRSKSMIVRKGVTKVSPLAGGLGLSVATRKNSGALLVPGGGSNPVISVSDAESGDEDESSREYDKLLKTFMRDVKSEDEAEFVKEDESELVKEDESEDKDLENDEVPKLVSEDDGASFSGAEQANSNVFFWE